MEQLAHLSALPCEVHQLQQLADPENYSPVSVNGEVGADKANPSHFGKNISTARTRTYKSILSGVYGGKIERLLAAVTTKEALRSSEEELRQISRQLLTIQEKERQRIAADLHDGLGQSLSLIKLSLELAVRQIKTGESDEAVALMQSLMLKIKETMNELHRTTMELHPPMLKDLGIIPTLSWFFREFESAWKGGKVEKDIGIEERDVSVPLKATIFRILQEAMNNVVKHSGADWLHVCLKKNDGVLQLLIEDNGCGFDMADSSIRCDPHRGFGLFTMMERARSTGGSFDMQSTPELGTRIFISWQITDDLPSGKSLHTDNWPHVCADK